MNSIEIKYQNLHFTSLHFLTKEIQSNHSPIRKVVHLWRFHKDWLAIVISKVLENMSGCSLLHLVNDSLLRRISIIPLWLHRFKVAVTLIRWRLYGHILILGSIKISLLVFVKGWSLVWIGNIFRAFVEVILVRLPYFFKWKLFRDCRQRLEFSVVQLKLVVTESSSLDILSSQRLNYLYCLGQIFV